MSDYTDPESWARAAWESDLPAPEVPATNDPTKHNSDNSWSEHEYLASKSSEVPAEEGTLALARKFAEWHDQTEETWRDHLDTAAWFATELQKARAEALGEASFATPDYFPEEVNEWLRAQAAIERAGGAS